MDVIVRNGLTTGDSIVLEYVETHRVKRIVDGAGHSGYEERQRLSLRLAEIQDRWGVTCRNHKDRSTAHLKRVHKGCNGVETLDERPLLNVVVVSGDLALQIFAERARLSLGKY